MTSTSHPNQVYLKLSLIIIKAHNTDKMSDKILITTKELSKYGLVDNLNEKAVALVQQQKTNWELAGKNYAALSDVQKKDFSFGHFQIHAHHNPGRMRSSAAKTDPESIAQRPCFLCAENLPPEQKGILFQNDYLILTNPFPIFPVHLTIPHLEHIPQRLEHFFAGMLDLSRYLPGFTVFYNGPRCGASAPDHFHFQAVKRGYLPVEKEFNDLVKDHALAYFHKSNVEIYAVENCLRRFLAFVSPDKNATIRAFHFLYSSLFLKEGEEPMLNVLAFYEVGVWSIIIFPREKQRPSHFFKSGKNQIIIGPAAVEMGGTLILPRAQDFNIINHDLIADIYNEVTVSSSNFDHMIKIFEYYE